NGDGRIEQLVLVPTPKADDGAYATSTQVRVVRADPRVDPWIPQADRVEHGAALRGREVPTRVSIPWLARERLSDECTESCQVDVGIKFKAQPVGPSCSHYRVVERHVADG